MAGTESCVMLHFSKKIIISLKRQKRASLNLFLDYLIKITALFRSIVQGQEPTCVKNQKFRP